MTGKESLVQRIDGWWNRLNDLARSTPESVGIKVSLGRTIVVATHLFSGNVILPIDPKTSTNARWATHTEEITGQEVDFVIGPDGQASNIGFIWQSDNTPRVVFKDQSGQIRPVDNQVIVDEIVDVHPATGERKEHKITFLNLPEGCLASLIKIPYPDKHIVEYNAVIRLPGNDWENDIVPNLQKYRLMSGYLNGPNRNLRSFLGITISENGIPFDRSLGVS